MNTIKFTGERFVPDEFKPGQEIYDAHLARYEFASSFVIDKQVLDISSGEGYGSDMLAVLAKKVYGVDKNDEVIDFAKNKYQRENLIFLQGTAEMLNFPENYFDCVVSFETIEHLSKKHQIDFLQGVKKVLNNNGLLIISTPDKDIYGSYDNEFHEHELNKKEFIQALEDFFSIENLYGQQILKQRNTVILKIRLFVDYLRNSFLWKSIKKYIPISFKKVLNNTTSKYQVIKTDKNMFKVEMLPSDSSAKYIIAVCRNKK